MLRMATQVSILPKKRRMPSCGVRAIRRNGRYQHSIGKDVPDVVEPCDVVVLVGNMPIPRAVRELRPVSGVVVAEGCGR